MSSANIAARAAKLGERKGGRSADAGVQESASTRATVVPRAKPVRVTTDLAPRSYRALVTYCQSLAETLGRAKVPHVEVMRALVDQLETDPQLQAAIEEALRTNLSK